MAQKKFLLSFSHSFSFEASAMLFNDLWSTRRIPYFLNFPRPTFQNFSAKKKKKHNSSSLNYDRPKIINYFFIILIIFNFFWNFLFVFFHPQAKNIFFDFELQYYSSTYYQGAYNNATLFISSSFITKKKYFWYSGNSICLCNRKCQDSRNQ